MAAGQLSSGRGTASPDLGRSSARLLPPAAETGRGSVRRLSARLRPGLGLCRPYRQPDCRRRPCPLRAKLPAGAAPNDRRSLGGGHLAADRANREHASPCCRDHRGDDAARGRRPAGRPHPRRNSVATGVGRGGDGALGRYRPAAGHGGAVRQTAAGLRSIGYAALGLADRPPGWARPVAGNGRAERARQAGCHECHDAQHRHQHAHLVRNGLGRLLRRCQPDRRIAARGFGFRRDGFRHAQSVPHGHRRNGAQIAAVRRRGGDACAGHGRLGQRGLPARSRALADRRGARHIGTLGRIFPAAAPVAATRGAGGRAGRVSRRDQCHEPGPSCRCGLADRRIRHHSAAGAWRAAAVHRFRTCLRAGEPVSDPLSASGPVARHGTCARRAGCRADCSRGSGAADCTFGREGNDRAAGSSSPVQHRRRGPFRPAVGRPRCGDAERRG